MTQTKDEIVSEIISLVTKLAEVSEESPEQSVEMLTIKECTEVIRGLSEHTVRQLISQHKLSCIRTGQERQENYGFKKTSGGSNTGLYAGRPCQCDSCCR